MDYRGLTIGDWLLDKEEGFPRRVTQVTSDVFGGCAPGVILENGMDYQQCEPILLTSEILEKNGLKKDKDGWYQFSNKNGRLDCLYYQNERIPFAINGPFISVNAHLYFVHELQHALRLCGLNELADNFKV